MPRSQTFLLLTIAAAILVAFCPPPALAVHKPKSADANTADTSNTIQEHLEFTQNGHPQTADGRILIEAADGGILLQTNDGLL